MQSEQYHREEAERMEPPRREAGKPFRWNAADTMMEDERYRENKPRPRHY